MQGSYNVETKKVIMEAVEKLRSRGIDAFGTTVDVRDAARCVEAVNECVKHFGRLDFLINNAAGNFMVSSENLSPGGFATVLGIDLQGCFHMSKAVLPHMKVTGPKTGAVIINITANLQDYATPFQGHAAAAKAGIDVLTNTLGVEWAEYGIRTLGIAPGGIAGTVGGPGGRVFGNDENKAASKSVGGAEDVEDFGEPFHNVCVGKVSQLVVGVVLKIFPLQQCICVQTLVDGLQLPD